MAASAIRFAPMPIEVVLAAAGVVVVGVTDTLLALRVLRAYRKARRVPHLVIVYGIASSFFAVLGASIVFAAEGSPVLAEGLAWDIARITGFGGAALAYGLVGVFATSALARSAAMKRASYAVLAALASVAAVAALASPREIGTIATTAWGMRLPFVALALLGSGYGFLESRSLVAAYERARAAGRAVDRVALARMRTMGHGFAAMAAGQAPLLGFAPGGRFDTPLGYACVATLLLGALGFVLACVVTWATPAFVRARWEAAP